MRALLLAVPLLLANADDAPADQDAIPPVVQAMLDAALASGNDGEVATVVKYAKAAAPESAERIERIASVWRNERSKAATRRLREAEFLDLVKGRAEFAAYVTEGNTNNVGVAAAVEVRREGLEWRHKVRVRGDYQESLGQTTQERYLAAYEPNWKFGKRAYLYGAVQYESDRFSGYYDRFSTSVGIGYSALKRPGLTLDVELGPAYRNTRFTNDRVEDNFAARGNLDFDWKLSPTLTFSQDASAYLQSFNSTVYSKTAVGARVIGPLSAQLSYTLQYESAPPAGRDSTDTTSRAALVVDF